MFYDIDQAIEACEEDPMLLFEAIKMGYRDVYEVVLEKGQIDLNLLDIDGNNLLMRLLKNKDYDLVNKYINNRDFNINHQNIDGDTIAHLLMTMNYIEVKEILEKVFTRSDFIPNIKNNDNETILDKSLRNHYLYMTMKVLEDKRFNNIGLLSFKNLCDAYIKNSDYGIYSKLNNFEIICNSLKEKRLMPTMSKLMYLLKKDENSIKSDFINSKTENLDTIINNLIEETI